MATIKVMSAGAVKTMVDAIGAEYEQATGNTLDLHFGTAGSLRDRLKGGETADVVFLPPAMIERLEIENVLVPGSRVDLGRTVTGVAIRAGAPVPDIATPEAFEEALVNARSVGYTDPGGRRLLRHLLPRSARTAGAGQGYGQERSPGPARGGRGAVGRRRPRRDRHHLHQRDPPVPGAQVIGPLPGDMHNVNTYSGAITYSCADREAAATLLQALTDPATRPRWVAAGLEPAF